MVYLGIQAYQLPISPPIGFPVSLPHTPGSPPQVSFGEAAVPPFPLQHLQEDVLEQVLPVFRVHELAEVVGYPHAPLPVLVPFPKVDGIVQPENPAHFPK